MAAGARSDGAVRVRKSKGPAAKDGAVFPTVRVEKGQKQCPSCFKVVGSRLFVCGCGHDFQCKKKKRKPGDAPEPAAPLPVPKKATTTADDDGSGLDAGQKECPDCCTVVGNRRVICPCGHDFNFSNKKKKSASTSLNKRASIGTARASLAHDEHVLASTFNQIAQVKLMEASAAAQMQLLN